jgi:two-component system, cell cycle sensor histidine kinase and response regulator CckA
MGGLATKQTMNREHPKSEYRGGPPGGHETVLVVDDEEDVRELLLRYLEDLGYTVREAADGEQALKRAIEDGRGIDLLVTDVHMPNMGGGELARAMIEVLPHVRIILISADAPDSRVCRPLVESGLRFVQKPFSLDNLARQIRLELDQATSSSQTTER